MISLDTNSIICRLKYPYRIVRNRILQKCEPIIVVLVVNNKCNFKCRYCFGNYYKRDNQDDFSTKELINIIDQLNVLGTRILTIHGGETLLRDDIGSIVDYIKKKGMYINLITNGALLKTRIREIMAVDNLCISLDGDREGNDMNRGRDTFNIALAAIKLAKKEGFRLRVHATITKYTMGDIGYLAKLAREMGFFLQFSILYQSGNVTDHFRELMLSDEETKNVIRVIIKYKKQGYPIYTAYRVLENALNWPFPYAKSHIVSEEIPLYFKEISCFYGKTKFIIDADGFVYPCFAIMDSFKSLNLKDVGIEKAIQHVRDTNQCAACIHFTNNDHNLLLGLSFRQVITQCRLQLKELIGKY